MNSSGFQTREGFHLLFLKHWAERIRDRPYALKGGVCLRLFHHSPRLSEDLDLDISGVSQERLRNHVQSVFEARAFQTSLRTAGIASARLAESKATETTQRWKILLLLEGGGSFPSRIEFSKRKKGNLGAEPGVPSRAILEAHKAVPFVLSHYGPKQMAIQKIAALAAPRRFAARDLFDLFHLLSKEEILFEKIDREVRDLLPRVEEKIEEFTPSDFRREVAPFLPEDLAKLYGTPEGFKQLTQKIRDFLWPA